jgi:CHAT domain-containing protein/tetratricopeptide (TPR) repeat protein
MISEASEAHHFMDMENWDRALGLYEQAIAPADGPHNVLLEARSLYSQAMILYWHHKYDWIRSAELAVQAADLYAQAGADHLAANAIQLQAANIIEQATEAGQSDSISGAPKAEALFSQALELFQQALQTQKKLGFDYDVARITNNIGMTYLYMGELDTAARYFQQAADWYGEHAEWQDEVYPLFNLATIDFNRGNLIKAAGWYQRAIDNWPPGKMDLELSHFLDNLASMQKALNRFDSALENYTSALELHRSLDDRIGQGHSLTGIGKTYLDIGEYELALEYLETALEIRWETNDGRGQVSVLNAMGNIHLRDGAVDKALESHREAMRIAASPIDQAVTQQLIARDYLAAGRPQAALDALEGTLALAAEIRNTEIEAETLSIQGEALLLDNKPDEAYPAFQQAADLFESLALLVEQSEAIFGMARSARLLQQDEEANELAWQAIKLAESMRERLLNPALRAFFLSERQSYYRFLIDHLMNMQDRSPAGDRYLAEALEVSERSRARALMDLVSEASLASANGSGNEEDFVLNDLYEKMAEARYRLDQELNKSDGAQRDEVIRATRQELAEIENELNLAQIAYRKAHPDLADLADPRILLASDIQAQLDPESVLLHYSLGEPNSYLWRVTPASIEGWPLAGKTIIEAEARTLYDLLARPAFSNSDQAAIESAIEELSGLLLDPLGTIEQERIIVVADGVLQYIPFSTLLEPGSGEEGETLLAQHEVIYLPSSSVVAAMQDDPAGRKAPDKRIAIFADPVFELTDRRFNEAGPATVETGGQGTRGSLTRTSPEELKRLPATSMEADAIASLVPPENRMLAKGFDASRTNVLEANLGEYELVHFATHGLIDSRYPALSAMAFSRFDREGRPLDALLHLHDIYRLDLNAELVTLSACSTALGREISGEGLSGLTQGLMHSGSKSVLASLWQVPDRATAELMRLFYQNLLEKEQKPAAALRNAQLALSSRKRWQGPYFWSAFVLQGDWR